MFGLPFLKSRLRGEAGGFGALGVRL
uniref:Uncharacterized protein n=1 Tax=Anguilla anguilla TaxID=7936 RepID=A0A0E9UWV1_ANGAN